VLVFAACVHLQLVLREPTGVEEAREVRSDWAVPSAS